MITKETITSAKLVKHLDIDGTTVKDSVSVLINGVLEVPVSYTHLRAHET